MEQLTLVDGVVPDLKASLPLGATYYPDFISVAEEQRLLVLLDEAPWLPDLKRRVQHYGYKYDYTKRTLGCSDFLGPLPPWAAVLGDRLVKRGLFVTRPNQIIVNEYLPGQGIAPHIDRESCFGPVVASLSLLSSIVMEFSRDAQKREVSLLARSLIVLTSDARYVWRHGIAARKRDVVNAMTMERERRISLTFRNAIAE